MENTGAQRFTEVIRRKASAGTAAGARGIRRPGNALHAVAAPGHALSLLQAVAVLAAGNSVGLVDARYGRRIPDQTLRWTVVTISVITAIILIVKQL
jgi:uncharacterized membrane protein YfcA